MTRKILFGFALMLLFAGSATAQTPNLNPITWSQANSAKWFTRDLKTVTLNDPTPTPVAWSEINGGCDIRAHAVQYALATAWPPGQQYPVIGDIVVDEAHVQNLVENPAIHAANIIVAGPLITFQDFSMYNGQWFDLPGDSERHNWFNHYATVINVEGTLMVLDLSVYDSLMTIEDWLDNFIAPGTPCYPVDSDEMSTLAQYWGMVAQNIDGAVEPPNSCGYLFGNIFGWQDTGSNANTVRTVNRIAGELKSTLDHFDNLLTNNHGTNLPTWELPYVYSDYTAGTLEDLCDESWEPYKPVCRPHTLLYNGDTPSGTVAHREEDFFYINLFGAQPEPTNIEVQLKSDDRDADLYMKFGLWVKTDDWDCRPYTGSSNEFCSLNTEGKTDRYSIMVRSYSGTIDYTVKASYSRELDNGVPFNYNVYSKARNDYSIVVPQGAASLDVALRSSQRDADLYLKYGSAPTLTDYDCRPYSGTSNEDCVVSNPASGRWYVMVRGYSGAVDYSINATWSQTP